MLAPLHIAPLAYFIIAILFTVGVISLYREAWFLGGRMHPYSIYRGRRLHTLLTSVAVHVDGKHLLINIGLLCLLLPEIEYLLIDDFGPLVGRLLLISCFLFSIV